MSKLWKSGIQFVNESLGCCCPMFSTWMVLSRNFPCASIFLPIHRENWHYEVMLHNSQHLPPWTCVRCCFSTYSVLKMVMGNCQQSEKFGVCLSKILPCKRLFMGVLGQEWRVWSTLAQCWGCNLCKSYGQHTALNKCVRDMCKRDVRKNLKKLREQNLWQHREKCVKNFELKKQCWDRRQNHPWVREKFHGYFHIVGAGLFATLCWRGGVCDSWDSFPWQCRHGRARVYPPFTASMLPGRGTSMYTSSWKFLASFAPPCPSSCGRKTLTLCLFGVSQKTLRI